MKKKPVFLYLGTLATALGLSSCNTTEDSSRLMMENECPDGYVSPESEGDYSSDGDFSDEEDLRSPEEIRAAIWESIEEDQREYEASPWYQLEVSGGFHKYVETSYSKHCVCTTKGLRPFKCTNGFIIMFCDACSRIYLMPGLSDKRGGEVLIPRPRDNSLEAQNTIVELGCKLFAAGETGWATDEEVNAYDWERNKRAYEAYLQRNSSAGSTPTRQNSTEIVSPPAIESR